MTHIKKLSQLSKEESGRVISINPKPEIRRRLQDLGLVPETVVTCVFKSPWKDPSAYLIRGAVIALRNEDADGILVSTRKAGVLENGF